MNFWSHFLNQGCSKAFISFLFHTFLVTYLPECSQVKEQIQAFWMTPAAQERIFPM
jgi:hypothetical protein